MLPIFHRHLDILKFIFTLHCPLGLYSVPGRRILKYVTEKCVVIGPKKKSIQKCPRHVRLFDRSHFIGFVD